MLDDTFGINRICLFYLESALVGFLVNYREKGSQDRGYYGELDFSESILRQRLQPCTYAFYNVNSDSAADTAIFSISGMYVSLLCLLFCSLKYYLSLSIEISMEIQFWTRPKMQTEDGFF